MAFGISIDLLSLAAGTCLGAGAVALLLWPRLTRAESHEARLARLFDEMAGESLKKSQDQFLVLAQEKLRQARLEDGFDLDRRQKSIADLVDPIGKSLKDMEQKIETLGKAGAGLEAQLKNFSEDQRYLREQTQNLVQVLKNPAARGRWGEMQLQRTFEMIGFIEGVHYTAQHTVQSEGAARKPDFVVSLPNGVQIVIDVKTPLDPYWDMMDSAASAQHDTTLTQFRQKIRDHLKSLSQKGYWQQFNSPEFVVMFLPSESLYSLAVSQDQAILEDASKANIILASPTTIMGLLRVVMYGWQQQKIADEARTVATLGSELYRRVSVFGEHVAKLGRSLNGAVDGYNKLVGSLDASVIPTLRKFRDLQVQTGGKDLPGPAAIEETTRLISSPELQSPERVQDEIAA